MTQFCISALSLLAYSMSITMATYGDYSVARMPQYGGQHEDSDLEFESDEYSDRSPVAPARLDYKYEEEAHGQSDDDLLKDIEKERIWDKRIEKKRKPIISDNDHYFDSNKNSFHELISDLKSNSRFVQRKPRLRNKYIDNEEILRLEHQSINHSNNMDIVDNKDDYLNDHGEKASDADELEGIVHPSHRSITHRKVRRKPRDKAIHEIERAERIKYLKLNDEDKGAKPIRDQHSKGGRRSSNIMNQGGMSKLSKQSYDYDEYFDMKRVQNMKDRLPDILQEKTVETTEAHGTRFHQYWSNRRAVTFKKHSAYQLDVATTTTSVRKSTTQASTLLSTIETWNKSAIDHHQGSSTGNNSAIAQSSDMSLAEKSKLSILKKALRKENSRNVSSSTKPPVLLQVTRKKQTVVMVEPQPPAEVAMRAREISEDSPERLQRARRLMRHKFVASARSIHDLIDNWDEMVCDYIDVALLDDNIASFIELNNFVRIFVILLWPWFIYCTSFFI